MEQNDYLFPITITTFVNLIRKKVLFIVLVTIAFVAASIVVTLVLPKVYRTETAIRVPLYILGERPGSPFTMQPILPIPEYLAKASSDYYRYELLQRLGEKDESRRKKVLSNSYLEVENPGDSFIIRMQVASDRPGDDRKLLDLIAGMLLEDMNKEVEKVKAPLGEKVDACRKSVDALAQQIQAAESKIGGYESMVEIADRERALLHRQARTLETDIQGMKKNQDLLEDRNLKETDVIGMFRYFNELQQQNRFRMQIEDKAVADVPEKSEKARIAMWDEKVKIGGYQEKMEGYRKEIAELGYNQSSLQEGRILFPAVTAYKPASPILWLNIVLAGFSGLILSVLIVVVTRLAEIARQEEATR
jgi:capsular polysaccharide biosynthesis protein